MFNWIIRLGFIEMTLKICYLQRKTYFTKDKRLQRSNQLGRYSLVGLKALNGLFFFAGDTIWV